MIHFCLQTRYFIICNLQSSPGCKNKFRWPGVGATVGEATAPAKSTLLSNSCVCVGIFMKTQQNCNRIVT